MKKYHILIIAALLTIANILQFVWNVPLFQRTAVPDDATAVEIAKAVLGEIVEPDYYPPFGYSHWTFDVTFNKFRKAWVVKGNLPEVIPGAGIEAIMGSTPTIVISMKDARVISLCWS